jgi:hypothetical protein
MAERSKKKLRPEKVIKAPEDRVKRASFTLPNDVIDFLRTQGNADKYITDLVHREMKKKEAPTD